MLKEKNPLLFLKIKEEQLNMNKIAKNILEAFFDLFDLILENPLDNFWYECLSIIIAYSHIISYIFDKTVRKYNYISSILIKYSFGQYGTK